MFVWDVQRQHPLARVEGIRQGSVVSLFVLRKAGSGLWEARVGAHHYVVKSGLPLEEGARYTARVERRHGVIYLRILSPPFRDPFSPLSRFLLTKYAYLIPPRFLRFLETKADEGALGTRELGLIVRALLKGLAPEPELLERLLSELSPLFPPPREMDVPSVYFPSLGGREDRRERVLPFFNSLQGPDHTAWIVPFRFFLAQDRSIEGWLSYERREAASPLERYTLHLKGNAEYVFILWRAPSRRIDVFLSPEVFEPHGDLIDDLKRRLEGRGFPCHVNPLPRDAFDGFEIHVPGRGMQVDLSV